jgi:hypothetical protein
MQLLCPHCRNNTFKVSSNGDVHLECLVCGKMHSAATIQPIPSTASNSESRPFVRPRVQWVSK